MDRCSECGLLPWDADDLEPGVEVCVCDDDRCDNGCWDEPALGRPVETLQVGEAL